MFGFDSARVDRPLEIMDRLSLVEDALKLARKAALIRMSVMNIVRNSATRLVEAFHFVISRAPFCAGMVPFPHFTWPIQRSR